jgi:L-threonylcarbamoyladenylate synthase
MIVLNLDEYNVHKKTIIKELNRSVFVYPTDTIYGIGCNANDEKLVAKVRKIKNSTQPFSVIVPSKEWIYKNCVVSSEAEEWIRKLPGPYTLILKLKNPKALAKNVYNNSDMTVGVRMPNHWFLGVAYDMNTPIVTTSANVSGQNFMTSLEDLDIKIRTNMDYVFYDGPKRGVPSTIIHLEGDQVKILKRTEKSSVQHKDLKFPIQEISINK